MNKPNEPSRTEIQGAGAKSFLAHISGAFAGGAVFLVIVATYFAGLFVHRASAGLVGGHLFKVCPTTSGKAYGTSSTMQNVYSWYNALGSSRWKDYEYSGRMMLTDARGGIGVIFLASRPKGRDRFYRLKRCGEGSTWALGGYGMEIKIGGETDTEVSPQGEGWYRFRVQVEDGRDRTRIRAKVWRDGTTEPAKWQVGSSDSGRSRNCRGSVGVWACSEGQKYFDDLVVRRIPIRSHESSPETTVPSGGMPGDASGPRAAVFPLRNGAAPQYLLQEDFNRFQAGVRAPGWNDRITPLDLSEAADSVSRFFRMNLLDFGGPWDEIVDLAAVAFTFCLGGFLGAIALTSRTGLHRLRVCRGKAGRIPWELLPFVALFAYAGTPTGPFVALYLTAGVAVSLLWRLLYTHLLRVFPQVNGKGVAAMPGRTQGSRRDFHEHSTQKTGDVSENQQR